MQFTPKGGSKPITEVQTKKKTPPVVQKEFNPKALADPRSGDVKSWSFSALSTFEKCPYQTYLGRVEKIPQESGPAAERGNMLHDALERYIRGETDLLIKDIKTFRTLADELREKYADGTVFVEDEWAYDAEWCEAEYRSKEAWCRMKLDVFEHESETAATVRDWKSGKKFGNEFKHSQQGQLYAIGVFLRYPEIETIRVVFNYIDHGEDLEKTYTRDSAMMFLPSWTKRALRMTQCTTFTPKPSISNCKWCPFKEHCEWYEA